MSKWFFLLFFLRTWQRLKDAEKDASNCKWARSWREKRNNDLSSGEANKSICKRLINTSARVEIWSSSRALQREQKASGCVQASRGPSYGPAVKENRDDCLFYLRGVANTAWRTMFFVTAIVHDTALEAGWGGGGQFKCDTKKRNMLLALLCRSNHTVVCQHNSSWNSFVIEHKLIAAEPLFIYLFSFRPPISPPRPRKGSTNKR